MKPNRKPGDQGGSGGRQPQRARARGGHARRGVVLGLIALGVAALVTWPAQAGMRASPLALALPALLLLVAAGAFGDMVGVAAAAADPAALHAMASRRLPGARGALYLKRHADKVASVAGDIVGDIAGTVSGAAAVAVAVRLAATGTAPAAIEVAAVAAVAALTVGGKAYLKGIALRRANDILYELGYAAHLCGTLLRRGGPQPAGANGRGGRRR